MNNPINQIEKHLKNGQLFRLSANYDKALELFEEVNRLTDDAKLKVDVLNEIGGVHFDRGDYDEGLSLFQRALELAKHEDYHRGRLKTYLNVARVYYEWSQYQLALNILEECHELQKNNDDQYGIIDITNSMIKVHWRIGNYTLALDLAKQTEQRARELDYQKGLDESLNAQANVYLRRGDLDRSLENYEKSLSIRKLQKDQILISNTYNSLAIYYRIKGDLYKSFEYANHALEMKNLIGDKRGIGISYHELGDIYSARGEFKEALKSYHDSLDIKEEIGDKFGIARTGNRIGDVYYSMGEYEDALIYYFESLKMRESMGEKRGAASCLQQIGRIYDDQGRHEEAIKFFNKALYTYTDIKDNKGMADLLSDIGTFLHSKGMLKKSLDSFERALDYYEDLEIEEGLVDALCENASALIDADKLDKASNQLDRASVLASKHGSKIEEQLVTTYQAVLFKAKKDLGTAKKLLLQAYNESKLTSNRKVRLLSCLNLAGIYLEEFKLDFSDSAFNETQRYVEEAQVLSKGKMLIPSYINTLLIEASLYSSKLDFNTAIGFLETAKETAVRTKLSHQEKLIDLQMNQLDIRKVILSEMYQELAEKEKYFKQLGAEDASGYITTGLKRVESGDIEQTFLLCFKQSRIGPELLVGEELPFDNKLELLTAMPVFFVTAIGQGGRHNEGLYGPLPVPSRNELQHYSSLIYSKLLPDKTQTDKRMKGKNFIIICFLYPQSMETFVSAKRLYIKELHDKSTSEIMDVDEVTLNFLQELKKQIFSTEINEFED